MNPFFLNDIIKMALWEDIGPGDLTSSFAIEADTTGQARFICKQDIVLSGLSIAAKVMAQVDDKIMFRAYAVDGDHLPAGSVLAEVKGLARSLLSAERVALNFLMHLSGIATYTSFFVEAVKGTTARIVDTRKTTPGLRMLEKMAVRHGGGLNHRFALYDGILIKDNHIAACGSITRAVSLAKLTAPHTIKIEVEADTLEGLREALEVGADIVLLDNMGAEKLKEAVQLADKFFEPAARKVILEASGGINLTTVKSVAESGVDLISVGALTHSAPAVDLSLEWD